MSRVAGPEVDGLLAVDKPGGPTSHDIVARVRATLRTKRVGHAGTLDPMATGLLPLVLGRATRLVNYLPASPKKYVGTLRLGIRTSTDDVTGEELETCRTRLPDRLEVLRAASTFQGSIRQVPPAVSARKIRGRRMYQWARKGTMVEAPPSTVEVSAFDLIPTDSPAVYEFSAEVSAGTYIRSLARDLGALLGCGGALATLRRTAIGPLSVDDAVPLPASGRLEEEALRTALIPMECMPLSPPAVRLSSTQAADDFLLGRRIQQLGGPSGICRVLAPDGRLVGIAEASEGQLQPRVVLG